MALLAGMATAAVSLWFANLLTQPLSRLRQAAMALAHGDLERRVAVTGPEELQNLATSFNTMADRLQRVLQDQRAFVANAAHEFRTPLTSIRLRAEMLRDGAKEDPAVAEQFLHDIESETLRLAHLVDELLDLSRIESGLIEPQRVPVSLAVLAQELVGEYAPRAEQAGIQLQFEAASVLPLINVDADQIRRVLINLLDNAFKFTPRGGQVQVKLTVPNAATRAALGAGVWLVLSVRDTGMGIPAEDLSRIFDRFYRSDKARARASGGSGLGLAIVKSVVEAHAGKIWVESQVGQGATFSFALPAS